MTGTLLGRAVTLLGALALLSCTGIIGLAVIGRPIPDVLQSIAVGSMTAVGALLARSSADDLPAANERQRPDTPG